MAEPRRRVPLVPDLQASDLVLEMLRTPLDDKAIAPLHWTPSTGMAAALSPATLLASHPQENRQDMTAPLNPGPLMARNGADFVRQVYLEVLGREPDGRASFYTAALLEGRLSKLEVLALPGQKQPDFVAIPVGYKILLYSTLRPQPSDFPAEFSFLPR